MASTILIVEDDSVFRRVLSFTVAKTGLKVETASNGQLGFERMMQGGIDFLVTDLQMPICTGIELLTRLQEIDSYIRPPTILCTAKGLELDTEDLKTRFSLTEILHKPFSPRKLSDLIVASLRTEIGPRSTLSSPTVLQSQNFAASTPAPLPHTSQSINAIPGSLIQERSTGLHGNG